MKRGKRILTILLTLCVAFTMMPLAGIEGMTAYAADGKGAEGEYLDIPNKFDKEIDISKVSGDIVIKDSKTYRIYSSEKKTVNHKIKIQKPTLKNIEPHVFIDGIAITMDAGSKCPAIEINNKASAYLYFYGGKSDLRGADYRAAIQKNRSENNLHILVAGGTGLYCYGGLYAAGIGGSADRNTNWYNIDMYGHGVRLYFGSSEKNTKWNGEIRATGGKNGAGIGGGRYGTGEIIHFMSGKITAKGGASGAGIGGGRRGNGNLISVYGGDITAQGGDFAAGIGSGFTQSAKSIRIYGGTVTAKAGSGGAGIGSGAVNTEDEAKNLSVSKIEISGGTVKAEGRISGAGIGGGQFVRADDIKITGGTVEAKSTYGGAGIGGGSDAIGHNITISGGDVYAKSYGGAGIGGGIEAMGDKIYLSGGHIKAECGKNLGNSPVAFGSGANIRNTNGMFNGTAAVPVEDVYIVLSHENQVDMNITAECRSFDGIRGYQTFTDSITNNSYGMGGDKEINFSDLSLPNAQEYGKITISADLTFKEKESKHQCFPADHTKNMGKYHIEVCETCGVRMSYNLTAESSRHDNLEWDTGSHEKTCVKCHEAIEKDEMPPTITGIEADRAFYIPHTQDGSYGFKTFYVTDEAWGSYVASGIKSVKMDWEDKEIPMVNGGYQLPAYSGSFGTPTNPFTFTVTAEDYAGNKTILKNISVWQKFLLTIVDREGKTIYSREFNDGSKPFIELGLPENAKATITRVDNETEQYIYGYDAARDAYGFRVAKVIKGNYTFRLEYTTEVSISGGNRSWNTYAANNSETVYWPKDDSVQFTVSATNANESAKYFVSEQLLTEEDLRSKDGNDEIQWTPAGENGEINIEETFHEFYIYAKATNTEGTIYVSTAKIVLDKVAPVAKVGTEPLSEGEYYWNGLQFSVEDESPVTVTDNGVILTPKDGVYTIAADEPEAYSNKKEFNDPAHCIVLTDSCGNTTTYDNVKVLLNYLETTMSLVKTEPEKNGIDISELSIRDTMSIVTTKSSREAGAYTWWWRYDSIEAPVKWDLENIAYDKTSKREQHFQIYGDVDISGLSPRVSLHEGGETLLKTSLSFSVAAAEKYEITLQAAENGSISLANIAKDRSEKYKTYEGEEVKFNVTAEDGYTVKSLNVKNSSGSDITVTKEDDEYSYTQPKNGSTITATFAKVEKYKIIHPADAAGFENGTELNEIMKALPESVGVMLNGDKNNIVRASVSWDASTVTKYDPGSRKAQSFTVKGTVDLSAIEGEEAKADTQIKVSVDKESTGSDGSSSSGGGGGSSGASTTPNSSTDTKSDGNTTTSPADVKTETTKDPDGKVVTLTTITVSAVKQKEILKQAKENKSGEIIIKVSKEDVKDDAKLEVNLDKAFIESILSDTDANLTIQTPEGEKTFTREQLKELADTATGGIIVLELADTQSPSDDDASLSSVKNRVSKMLLSVRSSKTPNKNIKLVLKMDEKTAASIETLKKLGYTVKYKFYRSTKKSSAYEAKITKKTGSYINTSGKKGVRYYYKARILVYDKNGKLVAQTELKQCKYACRVR